MNTTINNKLQRVLDLMNELETDQRIEIFNEFSDEWLMSLGLSKIEPLSIDEYNAKLEQGLSDYKKGDTLSHSEMKAEISEWTK